MAAAVSCLQTALTAVIQCNQCQNQLQQPHTLEQCLHSFCKICLDGIQKKTKESDSGWVCPECSTFSTEKDIRTNSFIEDLITISKGENECDETVKLKCKQCPKKDKEATGKCTDCKIELCDDCNISHLQIPILRNHTIENINETSDQVIDKLLFCTIHKTCPVEFNCKTCEKPTCLSCNLSDHNKHEIETVGKAIERLQPEMESKSDEIKSHIDAMESQIQNIKKEIDSTKESYAFCRLEMDERLEALINRLKAMKAQLEDEVTEQESVALDILENVKVNLENQLSLAKNLTNIVEVVTNTARHTSLLQEMQAGLYSKIEQTSNIQKESADFKILVPEFQDEQNLSIILDELQNLIGQLSYNVQQCNVDGAIWTANEFMCDSFKDIFEKEHIKEMEIDIDVNWCNRISYFEHKLWIGCPDDGKIKVYNKKGELVNTIETEKEIIVIRKVNNGDIIAAGEGLYVTNNECSEWKKLSAGVFSDLCVHSNKFSVFDHKNQKVMTFSLKHDHESGNKIWLEEASFTVNMSETFVSNSTLLVDMDSNFIVCSSKNILKYTGNGVSFEEDISLGYTGFLCGADCLGNLLTTNFGAGEIYVSELVNDLPRHNRERLCLNQNFKGQELRDIAIDNNSNIWYLEGNNDGFRLIKFKAM